MLTEVTRSQPVDIILPIRTPIWNPVRWEGVHVRQHNAEMVIIGPSSVGVASRYVGERTEAEWRSVTVEATSEGTVTDRNARWGPCKSTCRRRSASRRRAVTGRSIVVAVVRRRGDVGDATAGGDGGVGRSPIQRRSVSGANPLPSVRILGGWAAKRGAREQGPQVRPTGPQARPSATSLHFRLAARPAGSPPQEPENTPAVPPDPAERYPRPARRRERLSAVQAALIAQ